MKHLLWEEIADLAGFPLNTAQIARLAGYRNWLRTEAIPAGGLGPGEVDQLDERHVGDSLLFASAFRAAPPLVADLGTGVGLPGIPLAILWPDSKFVLVDRSQKRLDLSKRACRVLGLRNVEFTRADISLLQDGFPAIVSRATIPPSTLAPMVKNLLLPGGMSVVGGSWRECPADEGWEIQEIRPENLDHTVWLLIMRRQ